MEPFKQFIKFESEGKKQVKKRCKVTKLHMLISMTIGDGFIMPLVIRLCY